MAKGANAGKGTKGKKSDPRFIVRCPETRRSVGTPFVCYPRGSLKALDDRLKRATNFNGSPFVRKGRRASKKGADPKKKKVD